MKRLILLFVLVSGLAQTQPLGFPTKVIPGWANSNGRHKWSVAYWERWTHGTNLRVWDSVCTGPWNVILMADFQVQSDGTVTDAFHDNPYGGAFTRAAVSRAHARGVKVLLTYITSWAHPTSWATSPATRGRNIRSICDSMAAVGFDGVDFDWEEQDGSGHNAEKISYVAAMRDSFEARWPNEHKLIAIYSQGSDKYQVYLAAYNDFDFFDVLNYDIHGTWETYVGWNANLYTQAVSAHSIIQSMVDYGIPKTKLVVGSRWNVMLWRGGTFADGEGPLHAGKEWLPGGTPGNWFDLRFGTHFMGGYPDGPGLGYSGIMAAKQYDATAKQEYLVINRPGASNDEHWSWDGENTIKAKVKYTVDSGYAGYWGWTVNGLWNSSSGDWYPQVDSLRSAYRGNFIVGNPPGGTFAVTPDSLPVGGGTVTLSWTSQNATSASINQGVGSVPLNGNTTAVVGQTTTFTLMLSNGSGSTLYTTRVGVALPSGQGTPDITLQATAAIALVPNPTGGGNPNIEIIRDGVTPPVGSTNVLDQFDTFTGGQPRDLDWIGYTFAAPKVFTSLIYQEGLDNQWGGCFLPLQVQVRSNGQWTDVQGLVSTPQYPGSNLVNFETYQLSFDPTTGDAIRIAGRPTGLRNYIGVAELRVFAMNGAGFSPTPGLPKDYELMQNYPNPFNPTTKIQYNLPVGANVNIAVYNVLGQEIATLVKGYLDAGVHFVDFSGENLTNGVYFYDIKAGDYSDTKKMVLLK